MSKVLSSAQEVVNIALDVKICEQGVNSVARRVVSLLLSSSTHLSNSTSPLSPWSAHTLHPNVPPSLPAFTPHSSSSTLTLTLPEDVESTELRNAIDDGEDGEDMLTSFDFILNWIFLVSVLNFSFWSDVDGDDEGKEPDRFCVTWKGETFTGYWSLLAALRRALDQGIDVINPKVYGQATQEEVREWFKSDSSEEIPLLEERVRVMNEAGTLLCQKLDGKFRNMIQQCNQSALTLVDLVVDTFPSFRDESLYNGRRVYLYKRAQILVAETWAALDGRGLGQFNDIEHLTMFADYRVPQILHSLGTMTYSSDLTTTLATKTLLAHGSRVEVELRAASIVAVERIRRAVEVLLPRDARAVTPVEIDFWLWDLAKDEEEQGRSLLPCHRTRSVYY